jgi:hypothetical protein
MKKKLILTTITIILLLTTINIASAIPKIKTTSYLEETNKHFLCKQINSSGIGICTANEPILMFNMYFISIDYNDPEANTSGISYLGLREFNITGPHRIVTFFFRGDRTLNANYPDEYCEINGEALYLEIFEL